MKTNIKDLARKIARLSKADLNELETALMENGIVGTLYKTNTDSIFENRDNYDVVMTRTGRTKLMLIKTIKETLGWGLKESKDLVDSVPCVVKESVGNEEAFDLKEILEEAGATIEIRES